MSYIPWIEDLYLLQLQEYDALRFIRWRSHNLFSRFSKRKKPLIWTIRLKLYGAFGGLTVLLLSYLGYRLFGLLGVGVIGMLVLLPGMLVGLVALILAPFTWGKDRLLSILIQRKLERSKKLQVIGITGSFGKTSVKNNLYEMLDGTRYTLKTPESFNTLGGIWRVIRQELTNTHEYFICEMGAYREGDIEKLTTVCGASCGIITGVGPQHLERFGSIDAIVRTKCELIEHLPPGRVIVNWDSQPLRDYVVRSGWRDRVVRVSTIDTTADYQIRNITMGKETTQFELQTKTHKFRLKTKLFGSVQVMNLSLAVALAHTLGVSDDLITQAVVRIEPTPHRLERLKINESVVIDNTYSSNVIGFKQTIQDIKRFKGKKAMVTPGIVELGEQEIMIHEQLGQISADVVDAVVLAYRTPRTQAFERGLKRANFKGTVWYLTDQTSYWQTVERLTHEHSLVWLENDITENYL